MREPNKRICFMGRQHDLRKGQHGDLVRRESKFLDFLIGLFDVFDGCGCLIEVIFWIGSGVAWLIQWFVRHIHHVNSHHAHLLSQALSKAFA